MKSRRISAGLILLGMVGVGGLVNAAEHAWVRVSERSVLPTSEAISASSQREMVSPPSTPARAKRRSSTSSGRPADGFFGIDHYSSDRLPPIQGSGSHP